MGDWYSFHDEMKEMFGGKVYRLCLSSGCTCPNRDGTLSRNGCIFCGENGSGDFASKGDIVRQIEEGKKRVQGKIGRNTRFAGYMAYFQSFTNTYGDQQYLAELFEQAISFDEIVTLSIATRPDCLTDEMIYHLAKINTRKPVFVELGLQTIHEDTARLINRCYELPVFVDAFQRLTDANLKVVVHVIIALPAEDSSRTKETVSWLSSLRFNNKPIDGMKLQLLYVLRGTALAELLPEDLTIQELSDAAFPRGYIRLKNGILLPQYTLQEYARLIRELVDLLPKETAIHRVTGDPPKKDLILPDWAGDKKKVLNTIHAAFT